jgi:uncharacterized DUF497 family protein
MARAAKFDWDDANAGHIARHGVTPEEVEQAFANDPLVVLAVSKAQWRGKGAVRGADR